MLRRSWPPLVLAALASSWGVIPVIVREVELSSGQLAASRIWLGTLLQFGILALIGGVRPPETSRRSVILAGLLLPLHWFTFFQAIQTTRVLVALVLVFVAAPAMSIAATRVLGEPLGMVTGLAVAGGFVGAAIAVDPSNGATVDGVLWALGSGGLLAAMLLNVKPGAADLGAVRFGAWQGLVASLGTLPWAASAISTATSTLPTARRTISTIARFMRCLGRCSPGVSMKTIWPRPGTLTTPRMVWRVVCATSATAASLSPTSRLSSVDLPTLVQPTSATVPARIRPVGSSLGELTGRPAARPTRHPRGARGPDGSGGDRP